MGRTKHTFSTKQIVALVEVGEDRLAQIERAGFIKRITRNAWFPVETLAGLVRFYRDGNRRGPRSAADARWRTARAREIEIRTAERERKLVKIDDATEALEDITGIFLTEISSLPASVTRDFVLRRQIEERIFEIRERISNRLEAQARSLQESGKAAT